MKKHIIAALCAAASISASAAVDSNAVLMTVDGHDVTVGEFEYLYNKNNTQQQTPQSLDDYLQMFINYKLKVADAEHAGLQDSPELMKEFNNFKVELAAPYLRVQAVEDSLVNESYSHRFNDVKVSHIMFPIEDGYEAKADSVRTLILNGDISFEAAAEKYSYDRRSSVNKGLMGWVVPGRFPWMFEKTSYDTPVGEISEVINSGLGYHIIRTEERVPSRGDVSASHILLMTRNAPDSVKAEAKVRIDSIYTELKNGADFADMAKRFSQDPGSARNGGSLGWFSHGQMVAEFDSVSFALKDGELSEPFATDFGWHIILRHSHRGVPALNEELRKAIVAQMGGDERGTAAADAFVKQAMDAHNAVVDEDALEEIRAIIEANAGGYDSLVIKQLSAMDKVVATFDNGNVSISSVMPNVPYTRVNTVDHAMRLISGMAYSTLRLAVLDYERDNLAKTNADYRNLINEYRDGILLYEISNQKVWDRAAKDTEGLTAYFNANKSKYVWEKPKFKSYIFFASSDSVLTEAVAYADSISPVIPTDAAKFTQDMRKRFGKDIKIERVIAAQGENPITDYLAFNGSKPEADKKSRWAAYAAWNGRILTTPEEPSDVRGAAVTDYQAALEQEWLKQLRKEYKVKVIKKVFKQLKSEEK